jgi:hypothetical protein
MTLMTIKNKEVLSEAARTLLDEANLLSYKETLTAGYGVCQEEYEEAMHKISLEATRLTARDRDHLAKIVRACKAAASSIDPDDQTPAGYRACRVDVHWYYEMLFEKVDEALEVAWWAIVNEMIENGGVTNLTQERPKTSEDLLSDKKRAQGAGIRGNSPAWQNWPSE